MNSCEDPVCHSKVENLMSAFGRGAQAVDKVKERLQVNEAQGNGCPLDRDELGQATWGMVGVISIAHVEIIQ